MTSSNSEEVILTLKKSKEQNIIFFLIVELQKQMTFVKMQCTLRQKICQGISVDFAMPNTNEQD
jgi:hypothetical protein